MAKISKYINKRQETAVIMGEVSKDLKDRTAAILKRQGVTWVDFLTACCKLYIAEHKEPGGKS